MLLLFFTPEASKAQAKEAAESVWTKATLSARAVKARPRLRPNSACQSVHVQTEWQSHDDHLMRWNLWETYEGPPLLAIDFREPTRL